MSKLTLKDLGKIQDALKAIGRQVKPKLEAGKVVEVVIQQPSKSRDQEKLYHAMINDIATQVTFYRGKTYQPKVWKAKLIEQFAQDKRDMGQPLRHDSELTSSLDGLRQITVRPSSTDFSVSEGGDFIEFLHAYGIDEGVVFGDRAMKAYESYKEAQI